MKDITAGVSSVILLMVAAFFWASSVNTADEPQSAQSGTPYYTYNGKQESERKIIKKPTKRVSKKCHNLTALHEAAHFVVYMELCKQYNITPEPVELSIIPTKKHLGHFSFLSNGLPQDINALTDLAGYAMNEHMGHYSHSEIMTLGEKEDSDIQEALSYLSQRQFDGYYKQALSIVQSLEPQIQEVAVRLEKEKIIKF